MNINYNEVDKTIEIKDGLKSHLFLMKLLMIVTLTNSVLNLYDLNTENFGFVTILLLVLGIVSIIFLYQFIVKRSGSEKIPIDQIKGLNERVFSGRKKYFITLKNGKTRDLLAVKSESDRKQLDKMFKKNGILV
ncbi:hypothetical protein HNP99_000709 [Flavobacterium sp. 28A]|uniref:hypothetical protein n=1 Tax=Flavobacterium sp. 28A TaxID=2735895 RepID=UPI0015710972|nr:hypothetical protein [Flavobacterium sp. 28A]NRT14369.1 hypothetical protein [Flavobacterium sp. 28A]